MQWGNGRPKLRTHLLYLSNRTPSQKGSVTGYSLLYTISALLQSSLTPTLVPVRCPTSSRLTCELSARTSRLRNEAMVDQKLMTHLLYLSNRTPSQKGSVTRYSGLLYTVQTKSDGWLVHKSSAWHVQRKSQRYLDDALQHGVPKQMLVHGFYRRVSSFTHIIICSQSARNYEPCKGGFAILLGVILQCSYPLMGGSFYTPFCKCVAL